MDVYKKDAVSRVFSGNGICIDFLICQGYARGGAQGGCYRRKYRDGEVDDFLPKFFLHDRL